MLVIVRENIFHSRFAANLISDTSHKDQIVEKENCWFPFHARTNKNIQIHSSGEMLRCDESRHPGTCRQELLVQMPLSMPGADQLTPPWPANHRMKHLLCPLSRYCSKHFLQASQLY